MSNLPNTQSTNDNVSDNNGQNNVPASTGSVFGEKPLSETSFVPEIKKPVETLNSPEAAPAPQPNIYDEEKVVETPKPDSVQKEFVVENVVDKTDKITTLHDIGDTKDKLTKEADEEEEHFIEEVEKHHGDL